MVNAAPAGKQRDGAVRARWRTTKRRRAQVAPGEELDSEDSLHQLLENALVLKPAPHTFDMDNYGDRVQLSMVVWSSEPLLGPLSVASANNALASLLEVILRNSYRPDDPELHQKRIDFRLEGLLSNLTRAQSQKQMTILCAKLSIVAMRAQVHQGMWKMVSLLSPGLLASHTWTGDFIRFARERRPPCSYEELPLVGGVMFDNYQRKVLYSSKVTVESHGYLLNMTNWASMAIPKMLAPPNFNAHAMCKFASAHLCSFLVCRYMCKPLALSSPI